MDNILQLDHVTKQYDKFTLKDVSFSLPKGSIMGFIGENGAGKTTTIKLILNQIRKDNGSVKIFGMDNITDEKAIKEQIGVVFDESYFHENLRPDDISVILKNIFKNWDNAIYIRYLDKLEIPRKKIIKEFSKGMKMKLSIATALSHHPKLLILDEATSGLDPVVRNEILDLFLEFIQDEEHAILISTHITSDLEKIADYVTFIHKGEIVFSQSKDDIKYHYGILHCGMNDFQQIDQKDIISYRKSQFGYEILLNNRQDGVRKYKDFTMDQPSLEDIMLFYVRREEACLG